MRRGNPFSPSGITCLLVLSCVMPAVLSSDALVGLDAVPVDVVVDGDRVQVVDPQSRQCTHSVRRSPLVPEDSLIRPLRNVLLRG